MRIRLKYREIKPLGGVFCLVAFLLGNWLIHYTIVKWHKSNLEMTANWIWFLVLIVAIYVYRCGVLGRRD